MSISDTVKRKRLSRMNNNRFRKEIINKLNELKYQANGSETIKQCFQNAAIKLEDVDNRCKFRALTLDYKAFQMKTDETSRARWSRKKGNIRIEIKCNLY